MRELSLFTGAGGGLLGTKLLGWTHIGYVGIDEYCQQVIAQRVADGILDEAPIFTDVREFVESGAAAQYRGIADVVTGGFPCQPFSVAGKQQGADDERNMWPATIECIRAVRPRCCLLENVAGLLAADTGTCVCSGANGWRRMHRYTEIANEIRRLFLRGAFDRDVEQSPATLTGDSRILRGNAFMQTESQREMEWRLDLAYRRGAGLCDLQGITAFLETEAPTSTDSSPDGAHYFPAGKTPTRRPTVESPGKGRSFVFEIGDAQTESEGAAEVSRGKYCDVCGRPMDYSTDAFRWYFSTVLSDLAEGGYDCCWRILSAAEVGAPHKRDRLFIVATDTSQLRCDAGRPEQSLADAESAERKQSGRTRAGREGSANGGAEVPDTERIGPPRQGEFIQSFGAKANQDRQASRVVDGGWWSVEPNVGRVAHGVAPGVDPHGADAAGDVGRVAAGVPDRVARLKAIGNGQVPLCVATAWRLLTEAGGLR